MLVPVPRVTPTARPPEVGGEVLTPLADDASLRVAAAAEAAPGLRVELLLPVEAALGEAITPEVRVRNSGPTSVTLADFLFLDVLDPDARGVPGVEPGQVKHRSARREQEDVDVILVHRAGNALESVARRHADS